MRPSAAVLATALLVAPLAGRAQEPEVVPVPPSAPESSSWRARLDDPAASIAKVRFTPEDGGARISAGVAAVFWRPADSVSSPFAVRAVFTELPASSRREGYGLLVGGRDLAGPDQAYTYFLVRGDGSWLVKRRSGARTEDLSGGWQASDALHGASEGGAVSNALAVEVTADSVRCVANGRRLAAYARRPGLAAQGIAGLRVNHRLEVRVTDFTIERGGGAGSHP